MAARTPQRLCFDFCDSLPEGRDRKHIAHKRHFYAQLHRMPETPLGRRVFLDTEKDVLLGEAFPLKPHALDGTRRKKKTKPPPPPPKKKRKTAKKVRKTALPKLWNFPATSEKQQKKQRKTAKSCQQFSACTIRRVPLSSLCHMHGNAGTPPRTQAFFLSLFAFFFFETCRS